MRSTGIDARCSLAVDQLPAAYAVLEALRKGQVRWLEVGGEVDIGVGAQMGAVIHPDAEVIGCAGCERAQIGRRGGRPRHRAPFAFGSLLVLVGKGCCLAGGVGPANKGCCGLQLCHRKVSGLLRVGSLCELEVIQQQVGLVLGVVPDGNVFCSCGEGGGVGLPVGAADRRLTAPGEHAGVCSRGGVAHLELLGIVGAVLLILEGNRDTRGTVELRRNQVLRRVGSEEEVEALAASAGTVCGRHSSIIDTISQRPAADAVFEAICIGQRLCLAVGDEGDGGVVACVTAILGSNAEVVGCVGCQIAKGS